MCKLNSIYLIIIVVFASCQKKRQFGEVTTESKYYHFVDSVSRNAIIAYRNANDFIKGKEYCLRWCDSLKLISKNNLAELSVNRPPEDYQLASTAFELNNFFNRASRNDLREYLLVLFTDQEYTHSYEVELHRKKIELEKQYKYVINKYFSAKIKFSRKYGILL